MEKLNANVEHILCIKLLLNFSVLNLDNLTLTLGKCFELPNISIKAKEIHWL